MFTLSAGFPPRNEVRPLFRTPPELRWLTKQILPFVHWHIGSFLCIAASSLLALATPLLLKWLIDRVLPQKQVGLLICGVVLVFLGNEGRIILTSVGNYLTLIAVQRMSLRTRLDLLLHLDRLSADYYESTTAGSILYLFKDPIDEIAYFGCNLLPAILRTVLATSLTIGTMFLLSRTITGVILAIVPIFLVLRQHFRRRLTVDSDAVQLRLAEWSSFLQEHVSGILAIQLLGRERRQERTAFRRLARTSRSHIRLFQSGVWFTAFTSLAFVLAMSVVIAYGGWEVIAGTLSVGSLVAFYSFILQLFEPLTGIAELYARSQRAFSSIRQVQSVLLLRSAIGDSPSSVAFPERRDVRFTAVEFGYDPQRAILRVPSLQISEGENLVIMGDNGAGKSTLVRLVARAYDVCSGAIYIGAEDIRHIRLKDLRQSVCYLPREAVLFDGTVASNLRFVRPGASDLRLLQAIHEVELSGLLSRLPAGLHQRVGPEGCQLSGGERQQLAIARAILQEPHILILDEATSCLAPGTERLVLRNLNRCLPATTIIVVSHRTSTILAFHRMLLLAEGQITADVAPVVLTSSQLPQSSVHRVASPAEGTIPGSYF